MMMHQIAEVGGTLVLLVLVHLIGGGIQTDSMARRKSDESPWLLVLHSVLYALVFVPIFIVFFDFPSNMVISCFLALLMSHGAIDTYTPIWLWARFIRRPQEMKDDPIHGFMAWSSKPTGLIITSGADQLLHVMFLVPMAVMAVTIDEDKKLARIVGLVTTSLSLALAALSVVTILFFWNKVSLHSVPPKPNRDYPNADDDENDERPSMPSQHDE